MFKVCCITVSPTVRRTSAHHRPLKRSEFEAAHCRKVRTWSSNTVKEVEARKPEDSAFAKKPAPQSKPEPAKPAEKKPEPVKAAVKTEEKPAEVKAEVKKPEEDKAKGDSVLFNLKNEKDDKKAPTAELEFGKNK